MRLRPLLVCRYRGVGMSAVNEYTQIMHRGFVTMQVLSLVLGGPGFTTYGSPRKVLRSRRQVEVADYLLWLLGVESQGTRHTFMFVKWIDKVKGRMRL
jgi:hypothetical protein